MEHREHVGLLSGGIPAAGGAWADFGAGEGAFTLAVRDLAGPEVCLYAVDRDGHALGRLREAMNRQYPGTALWLVEGDFREPLQLPLLDGIVSANSLHFVRAEGQVEALSAWRGHLRTGGRLIVVEYDSDVRNRWVPYPISFRRLEEMASQAGYGKPQMLASRGTRIMGRMYAAVITPVPSPGRRGAWDEGGEATSGGERGEPRRRWWQRR